LPGPHVHVPFDQLDRYLTFIRNERINLEIYFGSRTCDEIQREDIYSLKKKLDYNPHLSIHAPFMDLSPGAVDLKVREVTIKRFETVLEWAEILRPEVVVFHSGYDKWRYDERIDIWLEGSLETWGRINKKAETIGVKVAIENIFEDEPTNLKILMEEMKSENFGVCFDTGHFNMFSKLPLMEWLDSLKPYIKEVHMHDNFRFKDEHLAIGDGDFDFHTLFSGLSDIDCVYTIEAHTVEDVRKSLKRFDEFMQSLRG